MNSTLSIVAAAKRVKRSTRTIERWIASGDLPVHEIRNHRGTIVRRYVAESDLLSALRKHLAANPNRKRDTP